jgi:DASH complex subunit DAD4
MPLRRPQLTPSQEFLASSNSTKVASQLFTNYHRNVAYNLDAVKKMPKPV